MIEGPAEKEKVLPGRISPRGGRRDKGNERQARKTCHVRYERFLAWRKKEGRGLSLRRTEGLVWSVWVRRLKRGGGKFED